LKAEKQVFRKTKNIWEESEKADINKNKLIILDNNTKKNNTQTDKWNAINGHFYKNSEMLLSSLEEFWISNNNANKLISKFSEKQIIKNLEYIKADDKIINKPWFLIKSLEQDYNFISIKTEKENKIKQKKSEIKKQEFLENQKNNIEKQKQEFYNNLLKNWVSENTEQYNEIFETEKKKFLQTSSNLKNPNILIKAKVNAFVKSEILGV
jgi:hypothetical protein